MMLWTWHSTAMDFRAHIQFLFLSMIHQRLEKSLIRSRMRRSTSDFLCNSQSAIIILSCILAVYISLSFTLYYCFSLLLSSRFLISFHCISIPFFPELLTWVWHSHYLLSDCVASVVFLVSILPEFTGRVDGPWTWVHFLTPELTGVKKCTWVDTRQLGCQKMHPNSRVVDSARELG